MLQGAPRGNRGVEHRCELLDHLFPCVRPYLSQVIVVMFVRSQVTCVSVIMLLSFIKPG